MRKENKQARRAFIKTIGLGSISLPVLYGASTQNVLPLSGTRSETESLLNGFEIEFLYAGDFFLGIGEVIVDGILLRSSRLPMFVHINTPEATELVNYRVRHKDVGTNEIRLYLSAQKKEGGLMEWMQHAVRNLRNLPDWKEIPSDAIGTEITLIIEPVERCFGQKKIKGISYRYEFNSNNLLIYKITDMGSWEPGGASVMNQFWMKGWNNSIVDIQSREEHFSTELYLQKVPNPNIFQFHPLQTHMQGFTFTSSGKGTLVTLPSKVSHIRSLFEKWKNKDEIVHFHEHCGDLSNEFITSPVEVYWIPGELDEVGKSNLYYDVREAIHIELHSQIGMKRERIGTYGIIEEWTEPDFDYYTQVGLKKLLELEVKTIFLANHCQNVMNTWGLSNMCCNVDFKISDIVGEEKLTRFCKLAADEGARIEMWGNTALSTTVQLFKDRQSKKKGIDFLPYQGSIMEAIDRAEEPYVHTPSKAIDPDNYHPRFLCINLRDITMREYWMKQWKHFIDDIGINGIFLDSSFNLSSDKFNFIQWPLHGKRFRERQLVKGRPDEEPPKLIESQYLTHLDWMVEMQKMGYHYCAEDIGVFGINRSGPQLAERLGNLSLWPDSYCDFDQQAVKKAGLEPIDVFFKGLAYRMMWKIYWKIKTDEIYVGIDNPIAFKLFKIYNRVNEYLFNRNILPEERGVIYSKNTFSVLWSFSEFCHELDEKSKITDMVSDTVFESKKILAKKNHVYLVVNENT